MVEGGLPKCSRRTKHVLSKTTHGTIRAGSVLEYCVAACRDDVNKVQ